MSSRPGRLFDLRSGEFGLVLTLGLTLMGNALALQVSGIVAISGFLTAGDANHMPIIWLVDYSLILLFSGLQTLIVDKFDRVRLMGGLNLVFALAFVVLRLMFAFSPLASSWRARSSAPSSSSACGRVRTCAWLTWQLGRQRLFLRCGQPCACARCTRAAYSTGA